jgi:hypothetical protein
MKTFRFAMLMFAFATLAHARPVVIEESATLTRPDAAWTFGRFGVAIDGDYALVSGERVVSDPNGESGVRWDGVAYLYRRSGTQWNYQSRLGPIGSIPLEKLPGLAMKDGIAVIWTDKTRIFELQGDTWVRIPLPLAVENTMQGPDIEIDGGRILISRNACYQSAVLRKSNGTWNIEGTLQGHDVSCSFAGRGDEQDIHGTHAILHTHPGPNGVPEAGAYLYRLNENGVGWRQTRFVQRENGRISNSSIALNWPDWASVGDTALGSAVGYELSDGVGAWSPYGLQPVDSYMDSFININSVSTTGIERFRDGFAQRNWSFDRNTYVINLFRINDDAARSSEDVATLQPSDGQYLGNQIASSGNRIIVGGWSNNSGNDNVRVFDVLENLEAPPPQVHDFELASGGAAWQPAPGSTFSVVRVGNSGVYRQGSLAGSPSSSLMSPMTNQAIQVEVTPRATQSTAAWVGVTTRREGSSFYYVGLRASGGMEFKRVVNGVATFLNTAPVSFRIGQKYRLRLESIGTLHRVYLDDVPVITMRDATLREGVPGVMTNRARADYDNVIVTSSPLTTINKYPFEDYYSRESWSELSGTWSPSNVGFHQSSLTDYGRAFTGALADDQILQARIRPTGFAGPDNWVGLMARYLDERNHLYVSLRARGVISLWRRTNGAITQLATRSMTVTPGTWYTVRVEVVGGLTRVYVNEQLQLSSSADPGPTVPNVSWSKGQVGLITYKATADFENILAYQP